MTKTIFQNVVLIILHNIIQISLKALRLPLTALTSYVGYGHFLAKNVFKKLKAKLFLIVIISVNNKMSSKYFKYFL